MGEYADHKVVLQNRIAYLEELKLRSQAAKNPHSAKDLTLHDYTATGVTTGVKGFCESWRADNPTSDGSASDNDLQLFNLWNFVKDKTDDELFTIGSERDGVLDSLKKDLVHTQCIIDAGEDPNALYDSEGNLTCGCDPSTW